MFNFNRFVISSTIAFVVVSAIGITGKLFDFVFPLWVWALVWALSFIVGLLFSLQVDTEESAKEQPKETKPSLIFRVVAERVLPTTLVLAVLWLIGSWVITQPTMRNILGHCPGGINKKIANNVVKFEGAISPCGDRLVHLPYRFSKGEILKIKAWGEIKATSHLAVLNSSGIPFAAVRPTCLTQSSDGDKVVIGPFTPKGGLKPFSAKQVVACFGGDGIPPSWIAPYGAIVYRDGDNSGWYTPSWIEGQNVGYIIVRFGGTITLSFNMFLWKVRNNRDCWLPVKCPNKLLEEMYQGGYQFQIEIIK